MERHLKRQGRRVVCGTAIAIGIFTGCSGSSGLVTEPEGSERVAEQATPGLVPSVSLTRLSVPEFSGGDQNDVLPVSFESEGKRPSTERSIQFLSDVPSSAAKAATAKPHVAKPHTAKSPAPKSAATTSRAAQSLAAKLRAAKSPGSKGPVLTKKAGSKRSATKPQTKSTVPPLPSQIADLPIDVEKFFQPLNKKSPAKNSVSDLPVRRFKGLNSDDQKDKGIQFHELDVLPTLKTPKTVEQRTSGEPLAAKKSAKRSTASPMPSATEKESKDLPGKPEGKGPLWDKNDLPTIVDASTQDVSSRWMEEAIGEGLKLDSSRDEESSAIRVESPSGPATIINPYKKGSDGKDVAARGAHEPSFGALSDELLGAGEGRRRFQAKTGETASELKEAFKAILSKPNRALAVPDELANNSKQAPEPPPSAKVTAESPPAIAAPKSLAAAKRSQTDERTPAAKPAPTTPPAPKTSSPDITVGVPLATASKQAARAKLAMVTQQANRHIRYAFDLGRKGAIFSARAEFVKALRIVAHSLDEAYATNDRGKSLTAGLKALEEAQDFVLRDAALTASLDVGAIVASHETSILKKEDGDRLGPFRAIQAYYEYAKGRLAYAGGQEPAASIAIYGLARTESRIAGNESALGGPKAIALHQAAVVVDPNNYLAANQLGVMFAKYGQLDKAKVALVRSLEIKSHPRTWQNLAIVSSRLGDEDLAAHANRNAQQGLSADRPSQVADTRVQWVDLATFQARSGADPVLARRPQTPTPSQRPTANSDANNSKFFKLPFGSRAKSKAESRNTINR